jgi:GNAT superfamily N-acetyltransferase
MGSDAYQVDRLFSVMADRQHGVVQRRLLTRAGVHSHTIDARLAAGLWVPVAPAVYRHVERPPDWRAIAVAGVLEGHRDAVLAGRTALGFLGMSRAIDPDSPPVLLVPHRRTHESAVAEVRQVNGWPGGEIVVVGDLAAVDGDPPDVLRCTSAARSIVDIASWATDDAWPQVVRLIDDAHRASLVTYGEVAESVALARAMRRRGLGRLRRLLDRRLELPPEPSALEQLARRRFTTWGVVARVEFEAPHPAYPGTGRRADAVCRSTCVVFEFDSRAHHLSESGFEADRARDSRTIEAGWKPIRLTFRDFTVNQSTARSRVRRACGLDGGFLAAAG